jgi:Helix-turn-helix domain/Acetamidase/Formamidase family
MRTSVADVAYRCGFGDAANFNRLFKERFGSSPGAFRTQHARQLSESARAAQRGWPLSALPNPKHKHRSAICETVVSGLPDLQDRRIEGAHHRLPVSSANVHWGYFSRALRPVLEIRSGDSVEVETLTQHASDDPELMIRGDGAAEEVFLWTKDRKAVDRRGAGPLDASIFGRGAGEGFGVHICTGPISVKNAELGDVIEVRIDDMAPRPSHSPGYEGRCFGSNVAAWWGYHYGELIEEPKPRENVTIYEIFADGDGGYAQALYAYRWSPQVDPFGVLHRTYDYPGVPVDGKRVEICATSPSGVRIPLRPHFGVMALAPREAGPVDSVPPAYFGGNLDNWRLG